MKSLEKQNFYIYSLYFGTIFYLKQLEQVKDRPQNFPVYWKANKDLTHTKSESRLKYIST